MKAVPRWKRLYEKYRSKGLRFVVVSSDQGACSQPDWTPDQVVCDDEALLQKSWKVGSLPQAFVWSWQGNLLVARGHVDDVERAVENYFKQVPRLLVEDPVDGKGNKLTQADTLRQKIRGEFSRQSKFELVASREESDRLRKIRKEGHEPGKDETMACNLGEEVSANSLVRTTLLQTKAGTQLLMEVFSVEEGCLKVWVKSPVLADDIETAITDSVAKLTLQMAPAAVDPGISPDPVEASGPKREDGLLEEEAWEMPDSNKKLVRFESDPPGAMVLVDGAALCQATPCSKSVAIGTRTIEVQLESYLPVKKRERISKSTDRVSYELEPNFGEVDVRTVPPGLQVTVDREPVGASPLSALRVTPGVREFSVSDPRYFEKVEKLVIRRGGNEEIELAPKPREGGIEVQAVDERGNELAGATVLIDGTVVGTTPYREKLIIGSHRVVVRYESTEWSDTVDIVEKQVTSRSANIDLARRAAEERAREAAEDAFAREQDAAAARVVEPRTGNLLYLATGFSFPSSGGFGYEVMTIGWQYDWRFLSLFLLGGSLNMVFFTYQDEYEDVEDATLFTMPMTLVLPGIELHTSRAADAEVFASVRPLWGLAVGDVGVEYTEYEYMSDSVYGESGAESYFAWLAEGGVRFNLDGGYSGPYLGHAVSFGALVDDFIGTSWTLRYTLGLGL
jgi:hypothetical protein